MASELQYSSSRFQSQIGKVKRVQRNSPNLDHTKLYEKKVTILAAPTGFGKTVLMSQWFDLVVKEDAIAAWLNFEHHDDLSSSFFPLLEASLQKANVFTKTLDSSGLVKNGELLSTVLEEQNRPVYWFWDCFENVIVNDCLGMVEELIKTMPANAHLIIASTITPNWGNVDFLLQDLAQTIDQAELRLPLADIKKVLMQEGASVLNEHQVYKLASVTGGWPAAVKMAALGVSEAKSDLEVKQVLSGHFSLLSQFIEKNIIKNLSPELQSFICRTGHLSDLNTQLCNELCGHDKSAVFLRELVARGFLHERVFPENSYTFPQFLKIFLKKNFRELVGSEADDLYSKATIWYANQNIPSGALTHALSMDDMSMAIRIITKFGRALVVSGQLTLLSRFFERLPVDVRNTNIGFLHIYIWTLIIKQKFIEANEALLLLKSGIETGSIANKPAEICPGNRHIKVLEYRIKQALDPEWAEPLVWIKLTSEAETSKPFIQEQIQLSLGAAYLRKEQFENAYSAFMEAARCGEFNDTPITSISALAKMAHIRHLEGRLPEALTLCSEAIDLSVRKFGTMIPVVAVPLLIRSEIRYELGDIQKSEEDHFDATRLFEEYKSTKFRIQALIHGAKLVRFHQDTTSAIKMIQKGKVLLSASLDAHLHQLLSAAHVTYLIENGEIPLAESVLRHEGITVESRNPSPVFV